jgi:dCMP deaminase
MNVAKEVSTWSKCLSRGIGAVIVRDGAIISTGFNGPPKHVPHCDYRNDDGTYFLNWNDIDVPFWFPDPACQKPISDRCPRQRMGFKSGEGMEYCPAVHAEAGAIINAAMLGHITKGATLYCSCPLPCTNCMGAIINAGIIRVVCTELREYRSQLSSLFMAKHAGIKVEAIE